MKKIIILTILLTVCLALLISCSPKKQKEEPTKGESGEKVTEKATLPKETNAPSTDNSTEDEGIGDGEWDTEDMNGGAATDPAISPETEPCTDSGVATEPVFPVETERDSDTAISPDPEIPTESTTSAETEKATSPVTPTQPVSPVETEAPTTTTPAETEENELGTHYDENEGEWDIVG